MISPRALASPIQERSKPSPGMSARETRRAVATFSLTFDSPHEDSPWLCMDSTNPFTPTMYFFLEFFTHPHRIGAAVPGKNILRFQFESARILDLLLEFSELQATRPLPAIGR